MAKHDGAWVRLETGGGGFKGEKITQATMIGPGPPTPSARPGLYRVNWGEKRDLAVTKERVRVEGTWENRAGFVPAGAVVEVAEVARDYDTHDSTPEYDSNCFSLQARITGYRTEG